MAEAHAVVDEDLLRRLPLPLGQLYRRAHNAKTVLERHHAAYYLWEAGLKLLASVLVAEAAARGLEGLGERLKVLSRPAVGHWWEIARELLGKLGAADGTEVPFRRARDFLLGPARDDLPRAAGLDALLRDELEGKTGARSTVRPAELFDRLIRHRNQELGHGAAGQKPGDFYDRLGASLLAGTAETLGRIDVLLGRRLIYISDVRRRASGGWLVERYELAGESARRIESLEVSEDAARDLPRPARVYLEAPAGAEGPRLRTMHPLVIQDLETAEFFFWSSVRGRGKVQYLAYSSGRTVEREEAGDGAAGEPLQALLAPAAEAPLPEEARGGDESVPADERGARPSIGEFELLSRIGRGGMGVVYRAWQGSLGRQVALKCILGMGDPRIEARFAREIRALGRVEHPNLVKIFSSGSEGDRWFYAMELVEGADLASVLDRLSGTSAAEVGEEQWSNAVSSAWLDSRRKEEPLSDGATHTAGAQRSAAPHLEATGARSFPRTDAGHLRHAVGIVRQAAGAANALHEAGIVHRDIKPGNILLTADGSHAVLMDLGLAQLADDAEGRLTRTRQFVGTLRYASPEQVLAAGEIDRRTDVYSLGATLWELLTLRPIFGAGEGTPTPELMLKIQTADPERPSRLNPRVPSDLEAIVAKCLEKDRARRYATARELAEDLGRWERGEPVVARPATLGYLLAKTVRRHRMKFAIAGALLLLALIGAATAVWKIERSRTETMIALFDLRTTMGLRAVDEGNPGQALLWFGSAAGHAGGDSYREEANRVRVRSWLRETPIPVRAFKIDAGGYRGLELDPGGTRLLVLFNEYADRTHRCRIWDLETEMALDLPALREPVELARWGPNGDELVLATSDGGVQFLGFPGGEVRAKLQGPAMPRALTMSRNGRWVAVGGEGGVLLLDRRSMESGRTIPHPGPVYSIAFNLRGDRLLTACDDDQARVFAVTPEGGDGPLFPPLRHMASFFDGSRLNLDPLFLDEDRSVVTANTATELIRWDAGSGRKELSMTFTSGVLFLAASSLGRPVLIGEGVFGSGSPARLWDGVSEYPSGPLEHSGVLTGIAVSPDGLHFLTASSDRTVRLWLAPGISRDSFSNILEPRLLAAIPHPAGAGHMVFSPDGRRFATASGDLVKVWTIENESTGDASVRDASAWAIPAPDGKRFLALGWYGAERAARILDLETGRPDSPLLDARGIVLGGAFSPDGLRVVTLNSVETDYLKRQDPSYRSREHPGMVRFWDPRSAGEVLAPIPTSSEPRSAAFRPDGKLLVVVCAREEVLIVDPATGAARSEKVEEGASVLSVGVRFSRDGRRFATWGHSSTVVVWDGAAGKPLLHLRHEGANSYDAAFSRDSRFLGAATSRNRVTVWDLATGLPLAPPLIHVARPFSVSFSSDGSLLLTACSDQSVQVWDWRRGLPVCPPLIHSDTLTAASFCPDERWILTAGPSLVFWEWSTGRPVSMRGGSGRSIFFSRDGGQAFVTSSSEFSYRISLGFLHSGQREGEDSRTLALLGEVLSGQEARQGGGVSTLISGEWLERWKKLRSLRPDILAFDGSSERARAWHRNQAALWENYLEWDAAAWHLGRLASHGERVESRLLKLQEFVRTWGWCPRPFPWEDPNDFIPLDEENRRAIEESALSARKFTATGPSIDFNARFAGRATNGAAYVARRILSEGPRKVRIRAGSDDAIRIWLNGDLVLAHRVLRGGLPDQEDVEADLRAGPNRVLVEVSNVGGGWNLYFRLEEPSGRNLRLTDDDRLVPLEE